MAQELSVRFPPSLHNVISRLGHFYWCYNVRGGARSIGSLEFYPRLKMPFCHFAILVALKVKSAANIEHGVNFHVKERNANSGVGAS